MALEGLCLLVMIVYLRTEGLPEAFLPATGLLPWTALGVGTLVSMRFRRSRVLFAVLTLVLADAGLARWGLAGAESTAVFHAIAFLLPINLFAYTLLAERGTFTPAGMVRFGIIGAQANNGSGIAGVAPGVKLMALKFM